MTDFFTSQFIAQAIGIIASALIILSSNQKIDNRLKLFLIMGNFLFAIHFLLLGAFAGMFVNFLNAIRVIFSIKFHKSSRMMFGFITIYILIGIMTYEELFDLLPFCAAILGTYSMFKLSGIKLRIVGIISSFGWLSYGVIFKSMGAIITETIAIILYLTTIYRLDKDKKRREIK